MPLYFVVDLRDSSSIVAEEVIHGKCLDFVFVTWGRSQNPTLCFLRPYVSNAVSWVLALLLKIGMYTDI